MIEKIEEKAEDQATQSMETDAEKEGESKPEVGGNTTSHVLFTHGFFLYLIKWFQPGFQRNSWLLECCMLL